MRRKVIGNLYQKAKTFTFAITLHRHMFSAFGINSVVLPLILVCLLLIGCGVGDGNNRINGEGNDEARVDEVSEGVRVKTDEHDVDAICELQREVINFAIDFLEAFNNEDYERLRAITTDDFFVTLQEHKSIEPQGDTWGTLWDTLKLIGIFNIPTAETISVSNLSGNFTQGEKLWFVFNLFPTDEAIMNPVGPSLIIEDSIRRTPHRWNVKLTLIFEDNKNFLVQDFMLTYDS